jgi:hypothetical protein
MSNRELSELFAEMLYNVSEKGGYRQLIIAMVMFDRGLDYEDAEIEYFTWYESNAGSFLHDILSGEAIKDGE